MQKNMCLVFCFADFTEGRACSHPFDKLVVSLPSGAIEKFDVSLLVDFCPGGWLPQR